LFANVFVYPSPTSVFPLHTIHPFISHATAQVRMENFRDSLFFYFSTFLLDFFTRFFINGSFFDRDLFCSQILAFWPLSFCAWCCNKLWEGKKFLRLFVLLLWMEGMQLSATFHFLLLGGCHNDYSVKRKWLTVANLLEIIQTV
jgi:hypothetical protein